MIVFGVLVCGMASEVRAQWSVTCLHPTVDAGSLALAASGGRQAGYAVIDGVPHASAWSGTAASFVSLHPASGADESAANGTDGTQQVGYVLDDTSFQFHAALWEGTAASFIDLNPAGSDDSVANGVDDGQQGGHARIGGDNHAALWEGSAASFVDLQNDGSWLRCGFDLLKVDCQEFDCGKSQENATETIESHTERMGTSVQDVSPARTVAFCCRGL